jgi:hypothetical protein
MFCMFCGERVGPSGYHESCRDRFVLPRQEVYWIPESRLVQIPERPTRIWTLQSYDPAVRPELPWVPMLHANAFPEDLIHDWTWDHGVLRYASRAMDHSVWILAEYP